MNYGATNKIGEICIHEISDILNKCRQSDIIELDTAQAYGSAETKLGLAGVSDFIITSKIFVGRHEDPSSLRDKVNRSIERLQVAKIENLLVHNEECLQLDNASSIAGMLHRLAEWGLVSKVGISSYNPQQALNLCQKYKFPIVQLPASALDNRLFQDGLIDRFIEKNIEVQIRSVFLQGILLESPSSKKNIPKELLRQTKQFRKKCREKGYTPLQGALGHVWKDSDRAKIVFGVNKVRDLEQILASFPQTNLDFYFANAVWKAEFDPRNWKS